MSIKPKQPVPALSFPLVGGETFDVSTAAIEKQLWIVVYRGKHCPVCHDYLETLNGLADDLKAAGISAVAVSADPVSRAQGAKNEWDIDQVTLGYGLAESEMGNWGLFVSRGISDSETDQFAEPGLVCGQPGPNAVLRGDQQHAVWSAGFERDAGEDEVGAGRGLSGAGRGLSGDAA